jgi:hypothetical protein
MSICVDFPGGRENASGSWKGGVGVGGIRFVTAEIVKFFGIAADAAS